MFFCFFAGADIAGVATTINTVAVAVAPAAVALQVTERQLRFTILEPWAPLQRCSGALHSCARERLGNALWLDPPSIRKTKKTSFQKEQPSSQDEELRQQHKWGHESAVAPPLAAVGQYQFYIWAAEAARRDPRITTDEAEASLVGTCKVTREAPECKLLTCYCLFRYFQ